MAYLVDSNMLLRWSQPQSPEHRVAAPAVKKLRRQGEAVVIVARCLVEFWAVASRPTQANGFGLPLADVYREAQRIKRFFPMLPDNALIYPTWENIVHTVGVPGRQVHDARLVAAMHVHGVSHILTFNGGGFTRFQSIGPGIAVVPPGDV